LTSHLGFYELSGHGVSWVGGVAPNHGKLWKSPMLAHLGDHEHLAERLKKVASKFDVPKPG
jgi:hypothetical protein